MIWQSTLIHRNEMMPPKKEKLYFLANYAFRWYVMSGSQGKSIERRKIVSAKKQQGEKECLRW